MEFIVWNQTSRRQHNRPAIRYQTDLTDAEWRLIEHHRRQKDGASVFLANARDYQRNLLRAERRQPIGKVIMSFETDSESS